MDREEIIKLAHQKINVFKDFVEGNLSEETGLEEIIMSGGELLQIFEPVLETWLAQREIEKILFVFSDCRDLLDVLNMYYPRIAQIRIEAEEIARQQQNLAKQAPNN